MKADGSEYCAVVRGVDAGAGICFGDEVDSGVGDEDGEVVELYFWGKVVYIKCKILSQREYWKQ